tara:strand:+ start:267 stop:848 length:582 start_codon:yes stop_codon:yes gene_type:complete
MATTTKQTAAAKKAEAAKPAVDPMTGAPQQETLDIAPAGPTAEVQLLEAQAKIQELTTELNALSKQMESLELSQRVWVKEQADGQVYKVGKTMTGNKKVSFYVAKSTKDQSGKYVSGAWKLVIATDNGSGPQATAAQELLDSGERFVDLEAFEKTFVNAQGQHNSYWMQTSIQGQGKAPAAAPDAPNADDINI